MENTEERDDLTPDEQEEAERDDMTGEEAHREGEFEYTSRMLEELHEQLLGLRELMGELKGAMDLFATMGATVREEEPEDDFEEPNPLEDPLEELDLDFD